MGRCFSCTHSLPQILIWIDRCRNINLPKYGGKQRKWDTRIWKHKFVSCILKNFHMSISTKWRYKRNKYFIHYNLKQGWIFRLAVRPNVVLDSFPFVCNNLANRKPLAKDTQNTKLVSNSCIVCSNKLGWWESVIFVPRFLFVMWILSSPLKHGSDIKCIVT